MARYDRGKLLAAVLLALGVAACAPETPQPPAERTQREKAEAVAGSRLPGSGAVGRLLDAKDSIDARNDRLDSMVR